VASISPLRTWREGFSKSKRPISPEQNPFLKLSTPRSGLVVLDANHPSSVSKAAGACIGSGVASSPHRKIVQRGRQPLHRCLALIKTARGGPVERNSNFGSQLCRRLYICSEQMACDRDHRDVGGEDLHPGRRSERRDETSIFKFWNLRAYSLSMHQECSATGAQLRRSRNVGGS
jgi:hypothetical protein